jgi:hypothetical protein
MPIDMIELHKPDLPSRLDVLECGVGNHHCQSSREEVNSMGVSLYQSGHARSCTIGYIRDTDQDFWIVR